MPNRWYYLMGALLAAPAVLEAQSLVQLSPRDSVVTIAVWRKACVVATARARVVQLELDMQEDSTVKEDLDAARRWFEALGTGMTPGAVNALEWLCSFPNPAGGNATPLIPSRREVFRAAAAADSAAALRDRSLAPPGSFTSLLGISEAKLVAGLTTLIMDRAAAEVQIAFVEHLNEDVCDPAAPLRPLFPSSCTVLLQDHLKLHKSVLRELHTALRADLRGLPRSAPLVVAGTERFRTGAFTPEQRDLVLTAYVMGTVVAGVLDGKDPLAALTGTLTSDPGVLTATASVGLLVDALVSWPADNAGRNLTLPAAAILQRLALVGLVLPDEDGDGMGNWPPRGNDGLRLELTRAMVVNANAWLIELGLARQPESDQVVRTAVALVNALRDSQEKIETLRNKLRTIPQGGEEVLTEYAGVVDGALAVIEVWAETLDAFRARDSRLVGLVGGFRRAMGALAGREYSTAAVALYTVVDSVVRRGFKIPNDTLGKKTKRILSLATALAQAESGEEVAAVLQSYAAPVQSYRGKRGAKGGYLAINAYLGAGGGSESAGGDRAGYIGVAAPIGVEAGLSLGSGFSLGVLGQVLDLGALASFRMTADDDALESEPEVGFAQVFSPGGYLVLGFPRLPLALGFGFNLAPSLRKLSADPETTRNAKRVAVFASIDMPLLRVK